MKISELANLISVRNYILTVTNDSTATKKTDLSPLFHLRVMLDRKLVEILLNVSVDELLESLEGEDDKDQSTDIQQRILVNRMLAAGGQRSVNPIVTPTQQLELSFPSPGPGEPPSGSPTKDDLSEEKIAKNIEKAKQKLIEDGRIKGKKTDK